MGDEPVALGTAPVQGADVVTGSRLHVADRGDDRRRGYRSPLIHLCPHARCPGTTITSDEVRIPDASADPVASTALGARSEGSGT